MKLEYLDAGSPDCPIIRLYEFSHREAEQLHLLVGGLSSHVATKVEVHSLPFVIAQGDVAFSLVSGERDQAIVRQGEGSSFECIFTPETWDNVAGLIEPFAKTACGSQWLAGEPGEAALLFSTTGDW